MKEDNKGLSGVYRAIVISNEDELEIGRIRIRVPFLHGTNNTSNTSRCIPDTMLPYAYPCSIFASQDAGVFLVPEVGSVVFVVFENGNPEKPLYIGQMFSKGKADVDEYYHPNKNAFTDSGNKRVKKAGVDDTPLGSYDKGTYKKYTLFKSPKGSTVEFDDSDEGEHLSIFDRLGQSFVMHAPATKEYSSGGINTRGLFNVIKDKFNKVIEIPAILLLKALSGSFLRIVSKSKGSCTDIITVYSNQKAGIHIDIGSDNRLLVFYKDTKLELTENSIQMEASTVNIDANTINLHASNINTSTYIHIGGANSSSINDYNDTRDEEVIENTTNTGGKKPWITLEDKASNQTTISNDSMGDIQLEDSSIYDAFNSIYGDNDE